MNHIIQNSSTSVPKTSHQTTSIKVAHSSRHHTGNRKHNQVKWVQNKHIITYILLISHTHTHTHTHTLFQDQNTATGQVFSSFGVLASSNSAMITSSGTRVISPHCFQRQLAEVPAYSRRASIHYHENFIPCFTSVSVTQCNSKSWLVNMRIHQLEQTRSWCCRVVRVLDLSQRGSGSESLFEE